MPLNARRTMRVILSVTKPAPMDRQPRIAAPVMNACSKKSGKRHAPHRRGETYLGCRCQKFFHSIEKTVKRLSVRQSSRLTETHDKQERSESELEGTNDPSRFAFGDMEVLYKRRDCRKQSRVVERI